MTIFVDLTDAAARLEEFIAQVEAGEEVVILRDGATVARLAAFDAEQRRAAIEKTMTTCALFAPARSR